MDFIFIIDQMPRLLPGLMLTIELSLLGFLIATIVGVPLGILRAYKIPILVSWVIDFYVFVVRGTPILVQIYAAYFLLPIFGIKISPFWIGIVALSFNSGGYQIEIARASILSMDKGQYEGSFALGLSKYYTLFFVIFLEFLNPDMRKQNSHRHQQNHKNHKKTVIFAIFVIFHTIFNQYHLS